MPPEARGHRGGYLAVPGRHRRPTRERAGTGAPRRGSLPRPVTGGGVGRGHAGVGGGEGGQGSVVGAVREVPLDPVWFRRRRQAALVDDGVVPLAHQGGVLEVGGAAVGPVHEVVRVGPLCGHRVAGEGAATVAQPQPANPGRR